MKKILISSLLIFTSLGSFAQSREQMGGIYYAYPPVYGIQGDTVPPSGYEPFYVSHYGRHGSRWLTNDDRYLWVMKYFEDDNNLTKLGKDVKKRLKKIWKNAKGNGGKLTDIGKEQHAGISQRMYENFISSLGDSIDVYAASSTVDRCIKSMESFTARLKKMNPTLNITTEATPATYSYIGGSSAQQKIFEKKGIDIPMPYSERFLKALFVDISDIELPAKLMSEMHTMASDMQDVGLKVSLYDLFTEDESRAIYEYNNAKMRHNNADIAENCGIGARGAIALWNDFEQKADKAIAKKEKGHGQKSKSVDLRFGHDTNLYRFMSLLRLPLTHKMDEVVPMAANLQMIFYAPSGKNSNDDILVKILHNEKITSLPIETDVYPYYHWDDVKAYYDKRIERLEHQRQLCDLNTMVGTEYSNIKSAGIYGKGSEEHGQTLPAVLSPNGQNFWTPQTQDTEKKCIAPYYYKDSLLQGFRNSHWIVGGCTQDYGSFTLATISGKLRMTPEERATRFSHSGEVSHPHYYSVILPDEHLKTEMTATSHGAIFRITPLKDEPVHIVLNTNSDEKQGTVRIDKAAKKIYACNPVHRIYQGWGEPAGFSGYIVLDYSNLDIVDSGTKDDIAYITIDGKQSKEIIIRLASSFTGEAGAIANMKAEIGDAGFEDIARQLTDTWTDRLHSIDVESGDTARVNQFYGALYRTSFLPREFSDADGGYPKFAEGKTIMKREGRKHYTDYSMWDTYRALHPLLNILYPTMSGDMMQSLVDMYSEGGWMPIFPCWNSYTAAMIGDHCGVAISDAYIKGIRNFDVEKAYEGLHKNAFESPSTYEEYKNGMGRRALKSYLEYGYIPLEDSVKEAFHTNEQVSRTLEYAFDDFALAQLAKALGKTADYEILIARSKNFQNVYDPQTGWVAGRHQPTKVSRKKTVPGKFEKDTDITKRVLYLTEGAVCHYSWYVPHDPTGLRRMMAGEQPEETANALMTMRLDSLFSSGHYWHGNEPCHQIPYMYSLYGNKEKTQTTVREILETEYNDTPGGLSGNDDAGQMSAWYVFSALGFYPLCPSTKDYVLSSPLFENVKINLENGKSFVIRKEGDAKESVISREQTINGRNVVTNTISHDDIVNGGTLIFK